MSDIDLKALTAGQWIDTYAGGDVDFGHVMREALSAAMPGAKLAPRQVKTHDDMVYMEAVIHFEVDYFIEFSPGIIPDTGGSRFKVIASVCYRYADGTTEMVDHRLIVADGGELVVDVLRKAALAAREMYAERMVGDGEDSEVALKMAQENLPVSKREVMG